MQIEDFPEMNTVDGVTDIGFALGPGSPIHKNSIGLLQFK